MLDGSQSVFIVIDIQPSAAMSPCRAFIARRQRYLRKNNTAGVVMCLLVSTGVSADAGCGPSLPTRATTDIRSFVYSAN
jgi:hypothetical protein